MTNSSNNPRDAKKGLVASVRRLMPDRALSFPEACRVAERQAHEILKRWDYDSPPFPEALITELPRIDVQRVGSLVASGATRWSQGAWRIRINAADSAARQRFTLAHEFKHVLDAPVESVIHARLQTGSGHERQVEAICDHFAACLLMPKRWVTQAWYAGHQDLGELAWLFEVSQQAMLIRLQTLGLIEPIPRCRTIQSLGAQTVRAAQQTDRRVRYVPMTQPTYRYLRRHSRPARTMVLAGEAI